MVGLDIKIISMLFGVVYILYEVVLSSESGFVIGCVYVYDVYDDGV
jgi:hypothetical protein